MKIAIDVRTAAGEKAGKGWYTFHLVHSLIRHDQRNQYLLYTKVGVPGFADFENAEQRVISGSGIFWHRRVARDAARENVDIFIAPSSYITPVFLSSGIKSVVTVHDLVALLFSDRHNKKAVFTEKFFLKKAVRRAAHIITVSKHTRRDLIQYFPGAEEKTSVVYCGASSEFKPLPKNSPELKNFAKETNLPAKFFLAVGTLEPRKNFPNLIRAFALLKQKMPDHHLIIVGGPGWGAHEVEETIREKYLSKKVHILGYLSGKSLLYLYNLATAFVFPSIYEGFGIPPLEAMQCGCPVIVSNQASLPEVVGDAGLYVDPEKPESIAAAMQKITDDELRFNLRNQGFIQSKKFSWDTSARTLHDIIEKLGNS